ncbi:MAG: type II toxin-antitoxin system RelE/ParE family toxin [Rhizobiales bacterium]|nr:type II toxin-antitoxin system RelE/ParE family toxin [Hyphomicrobiales bacterium]
MKVRYTLPALADLDAVLGYIETQSPQGARRVRLRLEALIELLADRPLLGARTDDPTIRRLTTPPYPYLVFYEVTGGEVVIHAVRHGARNPASMPGIGIP